MTDQLSKVFAALADPTRRDMVSRLCAADATVGELAAPYDVSMQAVSKHLKVLEGAGLVTRGKDAQRRPVHLEAEVFDLMTKWIERYRQQAEERYQRLDAVLAAMNETRPTPPRKNRIMSTTMTTADGTTTIEADPTVPLVRMTRDFRATPAQLVRAHTDPELFVQWVGPNDIDTRIDHWDARTGGSWRYINTHDGEEYGFHGCFHEVRDDRLVQTFTFEGVPGRCRAGDDVVRGPRRRAHPDALHLAGRQLRGPRRDGCPAAWRSASTTATPSSTGCWPTAPSDPARRHPRWLPTATTSYDVVGDRCLSGSMDQRISFVTLAVADLDRTRAFYVDGLGWTPELFVPGEVLMIRAGDKLVLSLWSEQGFEAEVGPIRRGEGLVPMTLAHNVATEGEVDEILSLAASLGAEVSGGERRDWGGYTGYFADPDGFRWEIAVNPGEIGQLVLP